MTRLDELTKRHAELSQALQKVKNEDLPYEERSAALEEVSFQLSMLEDDLAALKEAYK
jgi:hypothetical protein